MGNSRRKASTSLGVAPVRGGRRGGRRRGGRSLSAGIAALTLLAAAPAAAAIVPSGCRGIPPSPATASELPQAHDSPTLFYEVNLLERADDLFRVTLRIEGARLDDPVLQFASTAPGTYQVMDIGRFVRDLHAYDSRGAELPVTRLSTNQWRLEEPSRVRELRYTIAETWDTPVEEHPVYPMAGTSLEEDHVLLNPHAVFGFPRALQDARVRVVLRYPEGWTVGTPLERDDEGAYVAADYDELVDSPFLLGRLSVAHTEVTGVPVDIYTYSKTGRITSDQLLEAMEDVLEAAGRFLGHLPVDRYAFLFHFGSRRGSSGAWEHSHSSEYVLPEARLSERYARMISDIAAHEFFHVVTPLNIHSEIIENFNFETPVPSEHVWLYEGVTEWASDAMQLRAGLKSPERYLADVIQKMRADRFYDPEYSLSRLALTSYTPEGQRQYGNIYQRGAVVAGLLDIRLLELSEGRYGLQQLIVDLMKRYGKQRPFPEDRFFEVLTEMTYPEIGDFLERYVRRAEPLPVAETYAKLGIELVTDEKGRPERFIVDPDPSPEQLRLRKAWLSNSGG